VGIGTSSFIPPAPGACCWSWWKQQADLLPDSTNYLLEHYDLKPKCFFWR
jgi:hypothetical protein